jgi:hypothetical protein
VVFTFSETENTNSLEPATFLESLLLLLLSRFKLNEDCCMYIISKFSDRKAEKNFLDTHKICTLS